MTAKDRLETVIELGEPDRVPVHDFSNLNCLAAVGYRMKDARLDARRAVGAALDFNEMSRSDFVFPCIDPSMLFADLGVELELPDDDYGKVRSRYFGNGDDIDSKELYDPSDENASPYFTREFIEKIGLMAEMKKADLMASSFCWGAFAMAAELRGIDQLIMDMNADPEQARKVLKRAGKFVLALESRCIEGGSDVCWISDPSASEDLISPEQFSEFGLETYRDLISGLKTEYGVPVMLHICGDTTNTMKMLPDLDLDVFSFDHSLKVRETKMAMNGKVAIMGNIDPVGIIQKGTADDVREASRDCIYEARGDGGFILSPGCEVPWGTPAENMATMKYVANTFGVY